MSGTGAGWSEAWAASQEMADVGDDLKILRETKKTARKHHACAGCGPDHTGERGVIMPGETYTEAAMICEGKFTIEKRCSGDYNRDCPMGRIVRGEMARAAKETISY